MSKQGPNEDQFDIVRKAETGAPNFDMDTETIVTRLQQWQRNARHLKSRI